MNKIKVFKLMNGEMIITEIKETKDDGEYELSYPLTIVPIPPERANGMPNQVGFMKAMSFSDYTNPMTLYPHAIAIDSDADKRLAGAYEQQVKQIRSQESGIVLSNSIPKELLKNNAKAKDFGELNL